MLSSAKNWLSTLNRAICLPFGRVRRVWSRSRSQLSSLPSQSQPSIFSFYHVPPTNARRNTFERRVQLRGMSQEHQRRRDAGGRYIFAGPDLFRHACLMGLEGLVSKHKDRPYRAGRSPHWVKVKNRAHPAMERVMDSFS